MSTTSLLVIPLKVFTANCRLCPVMAPAQAHSSASVVTQERLASAMTHGRLLRSICAEAVCASCTTDPSSSKAQSQSPTSQTRCW
ncbi:hypothetical protein F5882DRAFT_418614 [Hyaloscypha sp. PMI_1271]|nr:hypothetical protein F5882DRAFT_418614 [Hyaloscypha sp. PMI_1271]